MTLHDKPAASVNATGTTEKGLRQQAQPKKSGLQWIVPRLMPKAEREVLLAFNEYGLTGRQIANLCEGLKVEYEGLPLTAGQVDNMCRTNKRSPTTGSKPLRAVTGNEAIQKQAAKGFPYLSAKVEL